ncbi:MAG: hypothetical protein ACXVUE_22970 [Solirubrobacteraceae bacterium]
MEAEPNVTLLVARQLAALASASVSWLPVWSVSWNLPEQWRRRRRGRQRYNGRRRRSGQQRGERKRRGRQRSRSDDVSLSQDSGSFLTVL